MIRACYFCFDDGRAFPGFTDGSRWNGFLNVSVTATTHARVLEHCDAMNAECGEGPTELHHVEVGADGLYSYACGFTTQEVSDARVFDKCPLTPEDEAIVYRVMDAVTDERYMIADRLDARAMAALECKREREWRVLGRRQPESFEARADVRTYREQLEAEHGEPLL